MNQLARVAEAGMVGKVQATANATATLAVESTPVDTGKARSNWRGSIDTPIKTQKRAPYIGFDQLNSRLATAIAGRFDESGNASAALQQIRKAIKRYRLGKTLWIVNNVKGEDGDHYLEQLNTQPGYTLQTDPFFVEEAAFRGRIAGRRQAVLPR